jgi:hypothetical protein
MTTLQRDLDKLAQWEQLWKMAFHPDKCNVLTISRNKTPVKLKYCLHGHVLESVEMAKYLRVTISEDLKWESHINNICGKANKTLRWGSHTEQAYSSDGLTNDLYACSLTEVEPMLRLRRRKPRVLLALPQMLMWLSHLRSSLIVTPKYFNNYGRWLSTQINVTYLPSHVIKHL